MVDEGEDVGKRHWVREYWKPVSAVAILSALVSSITINEAYVKWHDARYIKRAEAMTIAAAETLTQQVNSTLAQNHANSRKLDFLLIQAAQREVYDAEIALSLIEKNNEQTLQWHDMRRDAVRRLDSAKALLDCFRVGRVDCKEEGF